MKRPPAALEVSAQGHAAAPNLEAEVLANLKQQAVGTATIADLGLPDEYLKRVAGRILRASFEETFRIVVADAKPADEGSPSAGSGGAKSARSKAGVDATVPSSGAVEASSTPRAGADTDASGRAERDAPHWSIFAGLGLCGLAVLLAVRRARRQRRSRR